MILTTWSASLDNRGLAVNGRYWPLDPTREARKAGLNRYGVILDAIVMVLRRNGALRLRLLLVWRIIIQASASIWPRYDWLKWTCVSVILTA
jgi:hypothetical protein